MRLNILHHQVWLQSPRYMSEIRVPVGGLRLKCEDYRNHTNYATTACEILWVLRHVKIHDKDARPAADMLQQSQRLRL